MVHNPKLQIGSSADLVDCSILAMPASGEFDVSLEIVWGPKDSGNSFRISMSRVQAMALTKELAGAVLAGPTARTGEPCPENGVWAVEGSPASLARIVKGTSMPEWQGQTVTWIRVRKD